MYTPILNYRASICFAAYVRAARASVPAYPTSKVASIKQQQFTASMLAVRKEAAQSAGRSSFAWASICGGAYKISSGGGHFYIIKACVICAFLKCLKYAVFGIDISCKIVLCKLHKILPAVSSSRAKPLDVRSGKQPHALRIKSNELATLLRMTSLRRP